VTILSGARNARDSVLSQKLYDRMKSLFPNEKEDLIACSILLSNTYSSVGDEEQAKLIRTNRLKQIGNVVKMGLVWSEVNGELVVRYLC
jgi:hypothetical protein